MHDGRSALAILSQALRQRASALDRLQFGMTPAVRRDHASISPLPAGAALAWRATSLQEAMPSVACCARNSLVRGFM
jgi:hypothetical protein